MRSNIRLKDRRARTIDIFVAFVSYQREFFYISNLEVLQLIDELAECELEELLNEDVSFFCDHESEKVCQKFWKLIYKLLRDKLDGLVKKTPENVRQIPKSIQEDIDRIFQGKSYAELTKLEASIKAKLKAGGAIDIEYWESILNGIGSFKIKAEIEEIGKLLQEKRIENMSKEELETLKLPFAKLHDYQQNILEENQEAQEEVDIDELRKSADEPKIVYDKLGEDEVEMEEHVSISEPSYPWQSEHTPQLPKYKNRVVMGFDWNQYNRIHYTESNPPPKVVQGYKFNIFYPNLADPLKTPSYRLEADPESQNTVLIRFIGGAPYRDVAFRIVDREWEYSYKYGFRCIFDKGVLQLHFDFRKVVYKR